MQGRAILAGRIAAVGLAGSLLATLGGCVAVDERAEYQYVRGLHLAPSPASPDRMDELAEVPEARSWRQMTVTALAERWPQE